MMINELISHKKEMEVQITLKAKATSEVLFFFCSPLFDQKTQQICVPFSVQKLGGRSATKFVE